jgi:hypothetical protein
MRLFRVAAVGVAAAAFATTMIAGVASAAPMHKSQTTTFTVEVTEPRSGGMYKAGSWTVTCGGDRTGNHPNMSAACSALKQKQDIFASTPIDVMCTMQFDQGFATVYGIVNGHRIYTTFSRSNGCEIYRWDNASALLDIPVNA